MIRVKPELFPFTFEYFVARIIVENRGNEMIGSMTELYCGGQGRTIQRKPARPWRCLHNPPTPFTSWPLFPRSRGS